MSKNIIIKLNNDDIAVRLDENLEQALQRCFTLEADAQLIPADDVPSYNITDSQTLIAGLYIIASAYNITQLSVGVQARESLTLNALALQLCNAYANIRGFSNIVELLQHPTEGLFETTKLAQDKTGYVGFVALPTLDYNWEAMYLEAGFNASEAVQNLIQTVRHDYIEAREHMHDEQSREAIKAAVTWDGANLLYKQYTFVVKPFTDVYWSISVLNNDRLIGFRIFCSDTNVGRNLMEDAVDVAAEYLIDHELV